MRTELSNVEEKVQEARTKRDTLLAKRRAAMTQQKLMERVQQTDRQTANASEFARRLIGGYDNFVKVQEDVDARAADVEARQELLEDSRAQQLETRLDRMKQDDEVDEELERLKRKLRK